MKMNEDDIFFPLLVIANLICVCERACLILFKGKKRSSKYNQRQIKVRKEAENTKSFRVVRLGWRSGSIHHS